MPVAKGQELILRPITDPQRRRSRTVAGDILQPGDPGYQDFDHQNNPKGETGQESQNQYKSRRPDDSSGFSQDWWDAFANFVGVLDEIDEIRAATRRQEWEALITAAAVANSRNITHQQSEIQALKKDVADLKSQQQRARLSSGLSPQQLFEEKDREGFRRQEAERLAAEQAAAALEEGRNSQSLFAEITHDGNIKRTKRFKLPF